MILCGPLAQRGKSACLLNGRTPVQVRQGPPTLIATQGSRHREGLFMSSFIVALGGRKVKV